MHRRSRTFRWDCPGSLEDSRNGSPSLQHPTTESRGTNSPSRRHPTTESIGTNGRSGLQPGQLRQATGRASAPAADSPQHHRWSSRQRVATLLLLLSFTAISKSQTVPAQSTQHTIPPATDTDPVPSPDPVGIAPATGAQTPSQPGEITKENGRYTLRTESAEVRLNASVIDATGRTIDTLDKDAFRVYEDGVPQTILGFRHEDLPVSLGILIDSSGSMYDKRAAVDTASLDFIKLSNREDEAFLVDFSSEAYIDQDFTGDINKLQTGLSFIKSSGGTALYDAVIASADYLAKNAKRTKQVLLVVTDGDDNASSATLESAIRRVQELDGPAIYCVGLLFGDDVARSEARHSREVLGELAAQTGGVAYFPKALRDVDAIAHVVAQDIRTQYTISYRSTRPPGQGGYRTVHVEAKEKGFRGLQVRTRSGYFPRKATDTTPDPAGQ